jgi:tRNA(Arg) A34 adenosine deaminase TadA
MNEQLTRAWRRLDETWQEVFRLGWEALGHGTVPVGAVVVDASGRIVTRGRNRIYHTTRVPGHLANSRLAHAEVDALIDLDPEGQYIDWTLYSLLEPCLLCVGATVMSTVGSLKYAGRDPYGGADGAVIGVNAHLERIPIRLIGPLAGPFGTIATLLYVAYYMDRKPDGVVVAAHTRDVPQLMPAASLLLDHGMTAAAANEEPFISFLGRMPDLDALLVHAPSR